MCNGQYIETICIKQTAVQYSVRHKGCSNVYEMIIVTIKLSFTNAAFSAVIFWKIKLQLGQKAC